MTRIRIYLADDHAVLRAGLRTLLGAEDRFVFAVADPENLVVEPDESDNTAAAELRVRSLPDLALAPTSLQLVPAIPVPGEPLSLRVTVANVGEQDSGPFALRAYLGDPAAGGAVLAEGVSAGIPGLGGGEVVLDELGVQDRATLVVPGVSGSIYKRPNGEYVQLPETSNIAAAHKLK